MIKESGKIEICDASWHVQVSAYLDGELNAEASALFEAHVRACRACAALVAEQRRLLAVLDAAFAGASPREPETIQLPKNFAEIVTARAQTDMSGLRMPSERVRALRLCVGLTLGCVLLLLAGAVIFGGDGVSMFARATESVVGVAGRAGRNASAGGAVVLRAIGGRFVSHFDPVTFAVWVMFAFALIALLRLIGSYHREHVRE